MADPYPCTSVLSVQDDLISIIERLFLFKKKTATSWFTHEFEELCQLGFLRMHNKIPMKSWVDTDNFGVFVRIEMAA